jgi:hypothetical protein
MVAWSHVFGKNIMMVGSMWRRRLLASLQITDKKQKEKRKVQGKGTPKDPLLVTYSSN